MPFVGISGYYPLRGGLGSEPVIRDAWCSLLALLLEADPIRYALGDNGGSMLLAGTMEGSRLQAPFWDS